MRTKWHALSAWLLSVFTTARGMIAVVMLILAGGRFDFWRTKALADALPANVYGWLLMLLGCALLATMPVRHGRSGRIVAAIAACLLAGMAWDVGYIGVTALMEGWLALCLGVSALSAPEC